MYLRREYMEKKLKEWRPGWDVKTIKSWPPKQLYAVYTKVQQQVLKELETARKYEQFKLF